MARPDSHLIGTDARPDERILADHVVPPLRVADRVAVQYAMTFWACAYKRRNRYGPQATLGASLSPAQGCEVSPHRHDVRGPDRGPDTVEYVAMARSRGAQRVLLINPPSDVYAHARITAGFTSVPQVSLATLGAIAEREGHTARVLDLFVSPRPERELAQTLAAYEPTVVGFTVMTPNSVRAATLARMAREARPDALLVAGGPHPSAMPEQTVADGAFDAAVIGEGEDTLADLLARPDQLGHLQGIAWRDVDGGPVRNPPRPPMRDLDSLPMPAWHLFDLERYHASRLTSRRPPVGSLETSRGCPYQCIYCSKDVTGGKVRSKSAARVVAEIGHARQAGFRELHVWDDHFATDLKRAKAILRTIIDTHPGVALNMNAGLRVDSVDDELLHLLKNAGCYQIALAPETGSEALLKAIKKGITLDESRLAFARARKAGLETTALFMIALPGETLETIEQTIRFAIELSPSYAKVCFATPLPNTELFDVLEAGGRIKTYDWSKYAFHNVSEVYEHPTLSWDQLRHSYDAFYRRFYLRPGYIFPSLGRGLLNGSVFYKAYYAIKTFLIGFISYSFMADRYRR